MLKPSRTLTILATLAGLLLTLLATVVGATAAHASGVGSGGSGAGGGGGGGGGCAANRTKWEFTSGKVPALGDGCINNTLTGSSCHTGSNVGSWIFYVTATSGSNEGKHISLPTSSTGFAFMQNRLVSLIQDNSNLKAGFTNGYKDWATAQNYRLLKQKAESVLSDGNFGKGNSAKWQEKGGSNYKASGGKTLTYVCVWTQYPANGTCSGVCLVPPAQYCSDYGVSSSTYAIRKGVTASSTEVSTKAEALAKCALHCPTTTSADPNGVRKYLTGHRGEAIPAAYSTAAKRGAYCYSRTSTKHTVTRTRTRLTGSSTPSSYYPSSWTTVAQGDDGTLQRTHPGPTKFVYQTSTVTTPWGKLLGGVGKTCPTPAQISAAVAATADASHGSVKLSATNKQAIAEGGILDVSEQTTYAAVTTGKDVHQVQVSTQVTTTTYSFTLANTGGEYGVGLGTSHTSTGAWSAWRNTGVSSSSCTGAILAQSPKETAFYQAYANHCDATDYTAAAAGNTAIANGDSLKIYSGSFVTPRVTNGSDETLGYAEGDRAGQFDKLCSYAAVRNTLGSAKSSSTLATSTTGTVPTGASAGPGVVTFFRDNMPHPFTVDHYVPVTSGVVTYSGSGALATMVSQWAGGTPKAPGVSNEGQFQMMLGGNGIFSASTATAPTLTDWSPYNGTVFSSRTLGIEGGDYSTLDVAADWPTDTGEPVVFTIKWIYAPQVRNTVPVAVGFTNTDHRYYVTGTVSTEIQGEVYGKQGTASATSGALPSEVAAATGSATQAGGSAPANKLDGLLYFGTDLNSKGAWIKAPQNYSAYYHAVKFVRATGD